MILRVGAKLRVKRDFGSQDDFKQGDLAMVIDDKYPSIDPITKQTVDTYKVQVIDPKGWCSYAVGNWDFLSQIFELIDDGQPKMPLPKVLESWYKEVNKELTHGAR